MRMCDGHMDMIRKEINDVGLGSMISKTPDDLAETIAGNGKIDPLYSATMACSARAIHIGGTYLLGTFNDGYEYCPLCEVKRHISVLADVEWVVDCVDAIYEHCIEHGLIEEKGDGKGKQKEAGEASGGVVAAEDREHVVGPGAEGTHADGEASVSGGAGDATEGTPGETGAVVEGEAK